jgi:hypothetical protein
MESLVEGIVKETAGQAKLKQVHSTAATALGEFHMEFTLTVSRYFFGPRFFSSTNPT